MLEVGSRLAGLRVVEVLARGGMGVVYRALDDELVRHVAVKVVAPELAADPAYRKRFREEMRIAASLEHPHVCPVYRAGEADGQLYVVMRLLGGADLGARLEEQGPPQQPSYAVELVCQVASALDHAHSGGLLHRDVKPDNVLLDEAGNAYLTDFGLAGETWAPGQEADVFGTLGYLAPERIQGAPGNAASDQYALACLAYAVLTGKPPFVREHEAALLYAHLREAPPSLLQHGLARLDLVLQRALAKDPGERYSSCSDFAEDLRQALVRSESPAQGMWPESLPRPATRLIGRQQELARVEALLVDPETRLLTLTGPGGTGKTRLALQTAATTIDHFPDGVHWISLAPLRDPAHALSAIAQALSLDAEPGKPLIETLAETLRGRELLLVLDNAEHLLPDIAHDVAALREVAGPKVLATSRERLDLQAEHVFAVPPLEADDGVELFNDRARYVLPGHDPADPTIRELCERLDQLPLALELAAARTASFTPRQLLDHLGRRLDLLRGGRDVDPRQQTLRATIDWSYQLLGHDDQRLFRFLSVFAGGCTLEAAELVCDATPDMLQSLIEKSFVRTRDSSHRRRYWMLETIREYGSEKLSEAAETADAERRHASYYRDVALESEALLDGPSATDALEALGAEQENIRLALSHAREYDDPTLVLEIVSSLRRYWIHGGVGSSEAYEVLRAVLERGAKVPDVLRARALITVGALCIRHGTYDEALGPLDEAVAVARALDDPRQLARALNTRGIIGLRTGDFALAESDWTESMTLDRELGDTLAYAKTLGNLALLHRQTGDSLRSKAMQEEALDALRDVGGPLEIAISLVNLGDVALLEGEAEAARAYADEALALCKEHAERFIAIYAHELLARCDLREGDVRAAREHLAAALEACDAGTEALALHDVLRAAAEYAVATERQHHAAILLGAAESVDPHGDTHASAEARFREQLLRQLATDLGGSAAVERGLASGRALSTGDALELAYRIVGERAGEQAAKI